MSYISELRVN